MLEIQDDAATTPVEGLTVDVFENFGRVSGDGNLTILNTATLRNDFSGAGRTIIAAGAVATVDGFLRLEGDRILQNDGTLGLLSEFASIQLQDIAQLQIGSSGTLQLDGGQSVNTGTRFDTNGDPINPNTRIVNDGRIEKLDTAERGSTFGSLSASTLDLNGTIEVVAGTLNIDALNTGFVDEAGFFVTTAEGVATYGSASSLIGGDAGIQLSGGRHQFTAGATSTGTLQVSAQTFDGDLSIVGTSTLGGVMAGTGQTTIAQGADVTINGFLELGSNQVLVNEGLLGLSSDNASIQLRDSAQLQISSTGTLQLDGNQRVDTATFFDTNGNPIAPNTRIVNDGRIEKLDTVGLFGSLQASTLELNGTVDVTAGTLIIDRQRQPERHRDALRRHRHLRERLPDTVRSSAHSCTRGEAPSPSV